MTDTVIVTGSRDWDNEALIHRVLEAVSPKLVVQGGARGADRIAWLWAVDNNRHTHTFPADRKAHGKRAGSLRNIEMLEAYPGALVVAFPLPSSIGTWHCVREARKRDHKVMVVENDASWSLIESEGLHL